MMHLRIYLARHLQVFTNTAAQLRHAPLSAFMTMAVIGITLALPAALYLAITNIERVTHGWDSGGQISLFLKREINEAQAERLTERIRRLPVVAKVEYISRTAAFAEFKQRSGFGELLDTLDQNPLPHVLIVHPIKERATPATLQILLKELRARDEVELAQLDLEWVRRLQAMLRIAEQTVLILAGLLAAAVLLIVGNTIRLAILNRRDEIEVIKLVGGTDTFIRRPFLYSGLFHGILGALLAWLILTLSVVTLSGSTQELAALYGSDFQLIGLGLTDTLTLVAIGASLGWVGSRLAVGRHLRAIEPS